MQPLGQRQGPVWVEREGFGAGPQGWLGTAGGKGQVWVEGRVGATALGWARAGWAAGVWSWRGAEAGSGCGGRLN